MHSNNRKLPESNFIKRNIKYVKNYKYTLSFRRIYVDHRNICINAKSIVKSNYNFSGLFHCQISPEKTYFLKTTKNIILSMGKGFIYLDLL